MAVVAAGKTVVVTPGSNAGISVTAPRGLPGPPGPPGTPGADGVDALWDRMTQAEFDALPVKDSNVLYILIG